jgi:uncharacterized LabA/DUF88 family protein
LDEKYKKYQRVAVVVDVQNLFYSAKFQYNARVNFKKLLELAVDERQLIRALAYVVQTKDIDQTSFLDLLKGSGYEVKSKDLKIRADKSSKGDWDMGIAIDSISLSEKIDVLVLVSGDGDYVDLLNYLKSRGVKIEVISFPKSTAQELIDTASEYIALDEKYLLRRH